MSVYKWATHARQRFLQFVDSNELRLFQGIVYFGVILSAAYMIYFGAPTTVSSQLGPIMNDVWVLLTLIGPLVVAVGSWLVSSGERAALDADRCGGGGRIYWGWYAQAGGDIAITMVFSTYVIAAFTASWLKAGIFAAFVIASLTVCAAILVLRDVRRILAIERQPVV